MTKEITFDDLLDQLLALTMKDQKYVAEVLLVDFVEKGWKIHLNKDGTLAMEKTEYL